MSIHAQLSEEAQARLNTQKRNTTLSSILFSILAIVLIFLILGIFLLPTIEKEPPPIVGYTATTNEESETPKKTVSQKIQTKPSPPSSQMNKVTAVSNSASLVSIPVPDTAASVPSSDFGSAEEDFGGGWGGDGFGEGAGEFGGVPATMQKRCTEAARNDRLKEAGGSQRAEKAVVKALRYLQETQKEDGSWNDEHPVGMTGYALLAYLGHCETPKSEEYGDTVGKAIGYLINIALENDFYLITPGTKGYSTAYEHGIATYALAEAFTLCDSMDIEIPKLKRTVRKVGDRIMEGQKDSGGWFYGYQKRGTEGGDNSLGSWQAQALKACKHTKIWGERKTSSHGKKAAAFVKSCQNPDGSIGYRDTQRKKSLGLTGSALLTMQMWGEGDSPEAQKAKDYIKENTTFDFGPKTGNLYYNYYNALAMMQAGGKYWKWYNRLFSKELIAGQQSDGSWEQSFAHAAVNNHMATCLATMMLEVYYRFLPGSEE